MTMILKNSTRNKQYLITLSAKTEEALKCRVNSLYEWLEDEGKDEKVEDIFFTLLCGRSHFRIRSCFYVVSIEDLKYKLKGIMEQNFPEDYKKVDLSGHDTYKVTQGVYEFVSGLSLETEEGRHLEIMKGICKLYCEDAEVDWNKVMSDFMAWKVPMPVYQFDHERYWILDSFDRKEDELLKLFEQIQNGEIDISNLK